MSEWACEVCTFNNIAARTICAMCETPRPAGFSSPSAPVAPAPAPLVTSPPSSSTAPASKAAASSAPAAGPASPPAVTSPVVLTPAAELALRVEEARAKELRAKARAAREEDATAARAARDADEQRRRLEAIKREALVLADREEHRGGAREREEEMAGQYGDAESALQAVYADYGISRLQLTCQTLIKILEAIIAAPADARVRRISRRSETIQKTLVRTAGGQSLMRLLGFKLSDDGAAFELPLPAQGGAPDVSALRGAVELLRARLQHTVSPVSELWPRFVDAEAALTAPAADADADVADTKADAGAATAAAMTDSDAGDDSIGASTSSSAVVGVGKGAGKFAVTGTDLPFVPTQAAIAAALATSAVTDPGTAEEQAFCAFELWKLFGNVLASDQRDRNFRCLDTQGSVYRRHLARHPWALQLLERVGFAPAGAGGVYLEVSEPDAALFEAAAKELHKVLVTLQLQSPVRKVGGFLLSKQPTPAERAVARKAFDAVRGTLVANLVAVPFEPAYHRVNVAKLSAAAHRAVTEASGGEMSWEEQAAVSTPPRGLLSLLRALGFIVSPDGAHAMTPFGAGVALAATGKRVVFDQDLLVYRAGEMDAVIKALEDGWV